MEVDFKNITIIGLGLIGGSIAKALKENGFKGFVYGIDTNGENINKAFIEGVIDKEGLYKTDLLILAIPIGNYEVALKESLKYLTKDCIITDVGSVKVKAHEIIEKNILSSQTFIGGHPMIGSEQSGFKAAKPHLFENAYYFLTSQNKNQEAFEKVETLINSLGAKSIEITPEKHDLIVARTSHLPHISAVMMLNLLHDKDEFLIDYVGGGFRDTTRIASGDPNLWSDILLNNNQDIIETIEEYMYKLNEFKIALEEKKMQWIQDQLRKAKKYREQIPKHLSDSIEAEHMIFVDVKDQPGMIAMTTGILAKNRINIKDIEIVHSRENIPGVLKLGFYSQKDKFLAKELIESSEFGKWNPVHNGSDLL